MWLSGHTISLFLLAVLIHLTEELRGPLTWAVLYVTVGVISSRKLNFGPLGLTNELKEAE